MSHALCKHKAFLKEAIHKSLRGGKNVRLYNTSMVFNFLYLFDNGMDMGMFICVCTAEKMDK